MSDTEQSVVFIGDELTAAGYRLAGLRVLTPSVEDASRVVQQALESSDLVLLTAEYARSIPERALESTTHALVAIVPAAREHEARSEAAIRLRRELGLGT